MTRRNDVKKQGSKPQENNESESISSACTHTLQVNIHTEH